MQLNIGDYVTRISHKHDMVFKLTDIIEDTCYLKGVNVRLCADSNISDLVKIEYTISDDSEIIERIKENTNLERDDYFYLPGKILHIDSDSKLSNTLTNPYKIREKAKIQKYKNHQKKHKMTKI